MTPAQETAYQTLADHAAEQGDLFEIMLTHNTRWARVYQDLAAAHVLLVLTLATRARELPPDLLPGLADGLRRSGVLLEEMGEAYMDVSGDLGAAAALGVRSLERWRVIADLSGAIDEPGGAG